MRNIFIKKIIEEARIDRNLFLLTGDLGFNCFEGFMSEFPKRFINTGVAENNMIGVGVGLALSGKNVCIYSIAPFLTFRCLEQIRNNICHNNLNIKLIGGGGGFSYGDQGISHNPTEDLAVMRALPNMKVLTPGSKIETDIAIKIMFQYQGPFYIRLGKAPSKDFYNNIPNYQIGDGNIVKQGKDVLLICAGNILENVFEVANNLEKQGLSIQIVSYLCIKPVNKKFLIELANHFKKIITIEEHSEIGGLGSTISDILMESKLPKIYFKKIALSDKSHLEIGNQKYLREINDLGIESMKNKILEFILQNNEKI